VSFLSEKGIKSPKADKDTLARKWKADLKALKTRLRAIKPKKTTVYFEIGGNLTRKASILTSPEPGFMLVRGKKEAIL